MAQREHPALHIDKTKYFDQSVTIEHADPTAPHIGRLENLRADLAAGVLQETEVPPMVLYVNALQDVRSLSGKTTCYADEMHAMQKLQEDLAHAADVLGLPTDHFSIDTSGEPLVIQEQGNEHVILPTHFEVGSYLNDPHADHKLGYTADQLPRIHIGKYVRIGAKVGINAGNDIWIGEGVWFAPDSYVLLQDHSGYERPAVGSRTVASTRMPGIRIEDLAMIGRKAMIKWDVGYIGKGAIVALQSTISKEVGDYSITGNQDKIISYVPYKAAFIEYGQASLEDTLRVSNWEQIKLDWQSLYRQFMAETRCTSPLPTINDMLKTFGATRGAKMLDMNPGIGNSLLEASRLGILATGISPTREMFPIILERAEQAGTRNIKLRKADPNNLPYDDGGRDILRNTTNGFHLVLNLHQESDTSSELLQEQLKEANRVLRPDGTVVFGFTQDIDTREIVEYATQTLGLSLGVEVVEQDTAGQNHKLISFRKRG